MTRKTQPVTYPYHIKDKELTTTSFEKDLGIWIASDLTWTKHVLKRCAKANKLLGFVGSWLRKSSMVSPNYRLDKMNRACPKESVHAESSLLVRRFLSRQINSFGTDTPIILARVYGSSVLLQSHK